jgi:fructosamine-3-kinase
MYSKEESKQLRKLFWTSFGKSFPRKWILYDTRIKGFSFKFLADTEKAMVCLDMESNDQVKNALLYEQLLSLRSILTTSYLPNCVFDENHRLENGKHIHRIHSNYEQSFNIHDKSTWIGAFDFFNSAMDKFEKFYLEYEDHIKEAIS